MSRGGLPGLSLRRLVSLGAGALLALLLLPSIAMAATYEGTVTNKKAEPMAHVEVFVTYRTGEEEHLLGETTTEEFTGHWYLNVTSVPAGVELTYVRFEYPGYVRQWYDNEFSFSMATPILWEKLGIHTALNATMVKDGAIEGKVTDAVTGKPVVGVRVQALALTGEAPVGLETFTAADGTYKLINQEPGNVKVRFQDEGVYYGNQYYSGKFTYAEAETVGVAPEASTGNINLSLVHAGHIEGRITDASTGVGQEKVYIRAYDAAGQLIADVTNGLAGGFYKAIVPGGGSYTLEFKDGSEAPKYVTQFYNDKATLACANAVAVAQDQTVGEINAAMTTSAATLGTCSSGGGGGGGGGNGGGGGGGGGGTPGGSGGGNSGSPIVTPAQIIVFLNSLIVPSGKAASISALLKAGGFSYVVKAPEAGVAEIDWYQVPLGAHVANRKPRKPKPVLVASGRLSFASAGTQTLKVKLTAAGKNLLKHAKRTHAKGLRLTSKGTFTPTGKPAVTATKTFTVTH